jgi:hypothetical protein
MEKLRASLVRWFAVFGVIALVIDTSIAVANGGFGVLPAITSFGWEGQPGHWGLLLP